MPIGLRRRYGHARAHHHARGVGAPVAAPATDTPAAPATTPAPAPATPAPASVPSGFLQVYPGWNVWDVWQADDPTFNIMDVGLSLERQLRIWVENEIKDNAPGSAVADPANPAALRGDQIQPIPKVAGLTVAQARGDIPTLAGALTIGSSGSGATLRTVRFWNRGAASVMPWPHDENYVVDAAYTPSTSNPVTNAPQPSSLGKSASELAADASSALTVLVVGAGVVLGVVLISSLVNSRKAT